MKISAIKIVRQREKKLDFHLMLTNTLFAFVMTFMLGTAVSVVESLLAFNYGYFRLFIWAVQGHKTGHTDAWIYAPN